MRFELTTSSLARRRSTAELLPLGSLELQSAGDNIASESSQTICFVSLSHLDHKGQALTALNLAIIF